MADVIKILTNGPMEAAPVFEKITGINLRWDTAKPWTPIPGDGQTEQRLTKGRMLSLRVTAHGEEVVTIAADGTVTGSVEDGIAIASRILRDAVEYYRDKGSCVACVSALGILRAIQKARNNN